MDKLLTRLRNLNTVGFIAIMVGLKLISGLFFGVLTKLLTGKDIEDGVFHFSSKWEEFFLACVAAPLLETLLFQQLLFKLLQKFKVKYTWVVVIGGLIFGFAHNYHLMYVINAFFGGMILMSCYLLRIGKHPFLVTCIVHAVFNLIASLLNSFSW
jgi:membrane protease YdiL (CAAX protease family)